MPSKYLSYNGHLGQVEFQVLKLFSLPQYLFTKIKYLHKVMYLNSVHLLTDVSHCHSTSWDDYFLPAYLFMH
jgi:hypothetical protein